jgi:LysM repeat protein
MKIKIPKFVRRKKIRASTARRSLAVPSEMDFEEMSEPNMKLSRALLIVLVLHVVAVAGIIAFNTIKTRQSSLPPPALAKNVNAKRVESPPANISPVAQNQTAPTRQDEMKLAHAKEEHKTERTKQSANPSVADSGKVYVVAKGDNPVTIARKLKVSYDSLLELNHIDDPRKLQIGQKLLIPAKTTKMKKSEE